MGHGVSYSVLQELLTEVAYNKTENVKEDEVALPDICINEKFTVLVEDNIDRLEETQVNLIIIQQADADNAVAHNEHVNNDHVTEQHVSPPVKRKRRYDILNFTSVSIKENMLNSLTVKSYNQELEQFLSAPSSSNYRDTAVFH